MRAGAAIGTGTVSADGMAIESDPGVGIRAPGWHFVQIGTNAQGQTVYVNNYSQSTISNRGSATSGRWTRMLGVDI